VSFSHLLDSEGEKINERLATVPVLFSNQYYITFLLQCYCDYPRPSALNGVRLDCNGGVLDINAPSEGK